MVNKSKEKSKKKNTKEKRTLDLDNEIIIGIKSLPNPEVPKKKKAKETKKEVNKKANKKVPQKNKKKTNQKNTEEIELKLGIEDEIVRKKQATKKSSKKVSKKTAKQQEVAKRKRKIIFRIIKWTILLGIVIGGGIYFLLSPFFNIKSITTSGNEKLTSDELVSLSGIQLEENTFKISNSKVEQAIKANAYVESIKLNRKLPDKIEIEIVERKPTYMISFGNAYIYVNNQGYLLEVSKTEIKAPMIIGYLTPEEELQEGNRLCAEDLQRLNSVIQIMNSANNNEIGDLVTKINISDKQDYVLELKSEKKTIHLGDTSNLSTKMLYIISIMKENKKIEGEIFVNTDLSNKGAIFREKI